MMQQTSFSFFFNDTATTEIYTLSLHDALPISRGVSIDGRAGLARAAGDRSAPREGRAHAGRDARGDRGDRKSTRLNSSHSSISYAVFCLKKEKPTANSYTAIT